MLILKKLPESNGAYDNLEGNFSFIPEGYVVVSNELRPLWEQYKPFIKPIFVNGELVNIEDNPESRKVPIEKLREDKLNSLNGMCSGAIYQGVDIGLLHYNFTEKTQVNLETIARLIIEGQTTFLYRADNEAEQRNYAADEMKPIIKAKGEWIAVNTNYYELLKKWISAESDEIVIKGIHYGSLLPSAYMQELATKLSSIGIDITKYAAMFS